MKAKISGTIILFCVGVCLFLVFTGCVKSNVPNSNTNSNTIKSIIVNSSNATLLDTALMRTGLDSMYAFEGPFTFFVATDQAFIYAGITNTVFDTLSDSQLQKILFYNTLSGAITSTLLPVGPDASVQTYSGDSVFITNNGSGMFINGIQIESTDLIASNGVIDAVAKLVLPPAGSIMQIAQADTSMSFFVAAVARTSLSQTDVGALMASGNIYTVFIPNNAAFRNVGYLSTAAVSSANPDSLSNVLLYHILPKRAFTSDFQTSQTQQTLLTNKTVTYGFLGGSTYAVQGIGNAYPSEILTANIMAHNGVIQVISQLLTP
jgi:uncharacterized surface protein with fasciclin (FAS1) repeats